MFPFRFWTARGRSWLRSPYGLPSPGPAPLPCSVIETCFEVTNSETAGQVALGAVFVSGILFLILSLAGLREMIFNAVSPSMKCAIAAGIGLFIAFIGLQNAGVIVKDPGS